MIKHLPSRTVPVVVLWLPRLEIVGVGAGRCQALSQMILPCCFIGLTLKKSKSTHNSLSYQTVRLSNTQLYWENKEIHLESSLQQGSVCRYNYILAYLVETIFAATKILKFDLDPWVWPRWRKYRRGDLEGASSEFPAYNYNHHPPSFLPSHSAHTCC